MSVLPCGIIIIDKPESITSQGVVSRVRRTLGTKRVGHGGTLDPMATGVLPVFVGRATRASGMMLEADKTYRAGFRCGFSTDTLDTTGEVTHRTDRDTLPDAVRAALASFVGKQSQVPPMYSALKKDGKKLYELARKGIEIEREPRNIEIFSIDYLGYHDGEHTIEVSCSKGTYIRVLIADIGEKLGTLACMSSLRRIKTGMFSIENAVPLDEVTINSLLPTDTLFAAHPTLTADMQTERKIRNGNATPCRERGGTYRVYAQDGAFLMLGEVRGGILYTVKSFFEVDDE